MNEMNTKEKKRKAENILFLLLGLAFGFFTNLLVSSAVELCNAFIISFPEIFKVGFWSAFTLAVAYPLFWVIERYSIILTKLGMEVFSEKEIKYVRRMRKYCRLAYFVVIGMLILYCILRFYYG